VRRPIRLPSLLGVITPKVAGHRCVPSHLEELFYLGLVGAGLHHGCVREHIYAPPRKFRADFCWKAARLIAQIDGGVWAGKSGHSGGSGITKDCERQNAATLAGWRVVRFPPQMVKSGEAIRVVRAALALLSFGADPNTASDSPDTPEASGPETDAESIRVRTARTSTRRAQS